MATKRKKHRPLRDEQQDALAYELGYGVNIHENARVELSPHLDLWMGARYGTVLRRAGRYATVQLDRVRGRKEFHVMDLKRV